MTPRNGGSASNAKKTRVRHELERQLAADLEATRRLYDVGILCARSGGDFLECLAQILDAAIAITGADKGNIQLVDPASDALHIATSRGFEQPFLDFFSAVRKGEAAACGTVLQTTERVIVEDVARSKIFTGQPALAVLLDAGVRAVQSTPLTGRTGVVLGMISTHFSRSHRPGERALKFMDLLALQAADYLERIHAEATLQATQAKLQDLNEQLKSRVQERSQALEETERRFQLLVDAVTDYAIYMLDPSGNIVNWNTGAERIKGYTARKSSAGISRLSIPRRTSARRSVTALETSARTGKFEAEGWRVRKDGRRFWAACQSIRSVVRPVSCSASPRSRAISPRGGRPRSSPQCAEDGGDWPTDRRDRARLQQYADGHFGQSREHFERQLPERPNAVCAASEIGVAGRCSARRNV